MARAVVWLGVALLALVMMTGCTASISMAAQSSEPIEITSAAKHTSAISALAVSHDGRFFVSGSQDKTLILWDLATGGSIRTFRGHTEEVWSAAISPDDQTLVSAGRDKTIRFWDLRTGRLIRSIRGHSDEIRGLAFLSGGKRLVSAGADKTVRVWDVQTGNALATIAMPESIGALAVLPDGQSVLVGGTRSIWLIDTARQQIVRTYKGHSAGILSLSVDPAGQSFASASSDSTYRLWSIDDPKSSRVVVAHGTYDELGSTRAQVDSVVIAPDGRTLASAGSDQTAKIWDMATGRLLVTVKAPAGMTPNSGGVQVVALSPDGSALITGDLDGAIKVWSTKDGASVYRIASGQGFNAVTLEPALGLVASRDPDQTVRLWGYRSGKLLQAFAVTKQEDPSADIKLTFAQDGKLLFANAGGSVEVWDTQTGERRQIVRLGQSLWNPRTARTLRKPAGTGTVYGSGFSPDGRTLLLGGEALAVPTDDMKIWVVDVASGKVQKTLSGHRSLPASGEPGISAVNAFAFSTDGRLVASGGDDEKAIIWETGTWRRLKILSGHTNAIKAAAFSPDGTRLATGGGDQTVRIWDVESGQPVHVLMGHSDEVISVAFDGNRVLASASKDLTIKYWDVSTGALLATRIMLGGNNWVTLTREGFFDFAGDGARQLSVVKGLQSFTIEQFYQALYRPDLVREALAGDPNGLVRDAASRLSLDTAVRSGDAPTVRITSPQDGAPPSSAASAEVAVTISDRGGGIGRVEWRVNGVTVGLEEAGLGRPPAQAGEMRLTRRLSLEPGDNAVEVVAYNGAGLIASQPARLRLQGRVEAPAPGRLFVLAIGVNQYADERIRLDLAVADAKAVGDALTKASKGLFSETSITTLLDSDARRGKIDTTIAALASRMTPADAFVFYVAGHGKTIDGRYYFVPQDFRLDRPVPETAIAQEQWQQWFARIPSRRSVLLFDTCESGSFTGARIAEQALERDAAAGRLGQATGRTILAASAGDQAALEGFRSHGLFTYALLEAIERADANGDGRIETVELAAYVYAVVTDISKRVFNLPQSPQIQISGSRQIFAKPTRVLPDIEPSLQIGGVATHRTKSAADLFVEPSFGMPLVEHLPMGSQVTLVRMDGNFGLVARGGTPIGFVPPGVLETVH